MRARNEGQVLSPSPLKGEGGKVVGEMLEAKDTVLPFLFLSGTPGYLCSLQEVLLKQAEATWKAAFEEGQIDGVKIASEDIKGIGLTGIGAVEEARQEGYREGEGEN